MADVKDLPKHPTEADFNKAETQGFWASLPKTTAVAGGGVQRHGAAGGAQGGAAARGGARVWSLEVLGSGKGGGGWW